MTIRSSETKKKINGVVYTPPWVVNIILEHLFSGDLNKLCECLNSEDMDFYIRNISKDYQGGYKSYSKSFIATYGVNK